MKKICQQCSMEYGPTSGMGNFRRSKFCSQKCMADRNRNTPEMVRRKFESRVKKTETCWLWTGTVSSNGYGYIYWTPANGKRVQYRAHRYSWELAKGKIPPGYDLLHTCHNMLCVNPDHLYLGNDNENARDRVLAGHCYRQKITPETAREIREAFIGITDPPAIWALQQELAAKHNTVPRWIWAIRTGRTWKHSA